MADPVSKVDVREVMAELRAELQKQRDAGLVTTEDLDARVQDKLDALVHEAEIDPDLEAPLMRGTGWNLTPDYRIRTHRTGVSATLVVGLKRLVRPFIRLYTDVLVVRQASLNAYVMHVLRALARDVVRLEAENAALRTRCQDLEKRRAEREDAQD